MDILEPESEKPEKHSSTEAYCDADDDSEMQSAPTTSENTETGLFLYTFIPEYHYHRLMFLSID